MGWLAAAVAGTGVLALLVVRQSASRALHAGAKLNQIGLQIQLNNLAARRFEKDFLLNIETEGVEQAKRNYAAQVPPAVVRIEQLAAYGGRIATAPAARQQFRDIDTLARAYAAAFAGMVAAKEHRGFVDTGAEGAFRTAVHQIENQLKALDKIEIAMLTLRRSEKDYLLRGQKEYITATVENVRKLKVAVDQAALSAAEKVSAKTAADTYLTAFQALLDADREVAAKSVIYQQASNRLEAVADEAAKAGQQAAEESLASASWTAMGAIIVVVLMSLVSIGAGIRYGSRISTNIVRPVKHLTQVAEQVSMGDLSLNVDRTSDDEIGDLEESLARLATAVRFFKADSEDANAAQLQQMRSQEVRQ